MTTNLTEGDLLIGIMKLTPFVKLTYSATGRTLMWADDKKQWEVHSFVRVPIWHYKGNDLFVALSILQKST